MSVSEICWWKVCEFDEEPNRECVERKCRVCGIERVKRRLLGELEVILEEQVGWSKWQHVNEGKSNRMDKVKKKGSVRECVDEFCEELGPLYACFCCRMAAKAGA